ncbi:MAG: carbamate kinase [Deltaproteobacteria bacterium]|jgi:carbamate kinase|nr:carbamate kinase [Deltaproteobacteria bacterium]
MIKKGGIVIALGGNAISKPGMRGTIQEQFYSTSESMEHIAELVINGYDRIIITHGNGPQVGATILRSEIASKTVYPLPMDTCVADTQGGMGYMIQQVLTNSLRKRGVKLPVATIVTQVMVDAKDPSFDNPSKPVGMFYNEREAQELHIGRGWIMKEDSGRGWRRVVPSPKPVKILESEPIKTLFNKGYIVIAGGGGGVSVSLNRHNLFYGTESVIDKDLTSSILATEVEAETLIILTQVEFAYLNFGKADQTALKRVTASELKQHLANGEFAAGSMKPKIKASLDFLEHGGKKVIITSIPNCLAALRGKTGTVIQK